MTWRAGKILMGTQKKTAMESKNFPILIGMVSMDAITIELIGTLF